jgi:hypothetical protein
VRSGRRAARELVEIVRAAAEDVSEGDRVVDVDKGVDRRQALASLDALDEALDRGAVARLLDAEALIGAAPSGDAGDRRKLRIAPARAAGLFALGDEPVEHRRTLAAKVQAFGNHDGDAEIGKARDELGDGEFEGH